MRGVPGHRDRRRDVHRRLGDQPPRMLIPDAVHPRLGRLLEARVQVGAVPRHRPLRARVGRQVHHGYLHAADAAEHAGERADGDDDADHPGGAGQDDRHGRDGAAADGAADRDDDARGRRELDARRRPGRPVRLQDGVLQLRAVQRGALRRDQVPVQHPGVGVDHVRPHVPPPQAADAAVHVQAPLRRRLHVDAGGVRDVPRPRLRLLPPCRGV
mmetsp:Transcript_11929/g.37126  ORF Transcript_11929/g.37126 Transcript_11929/m.37126 type:complete len:214 (+) Transcript_11929:341-982(+)